MAQLVTSVTTAATTLNKAYRKMQGGLLKGFQSMSEEWDLMDDIKDYEITLSAREMTVPIDLNGAGRSAMIPEGGLEKNPVTPGLQELTLTWANLNERWMTTLTAKYLDSKGQAGQVIRQLRLQAMKALEAISNTVAWQFYGFSTGYACQTSTNATSASQTLTLINAFGISGLGNAAYLASMFTVYDRIAIVRAGALVANGIGQITAVDASAGTISVTMIGSCDVDANDYIVFANSVENTTIDGTDYNISPVGLLDACQSSSVHGLANTVANWNPALTSATAGRFSGLKIRKARQAIHNTGNAKPDTVIWSQGVANDTIEAERALSRFDSTMGMELDGSVKAKGITFFSSRKVPPGYAFVADMKNAVGKYSLLPKPGSGVPPFSDGDKMENRNALQFSIDFPYAYVWKSRRCLAYFANQTEQ
jgi:hypothetical protein